MKTDVYIYNLDGNRAAVRDYAKAIAEMSAKSSNAYVMAFDKDNEMLWTVQAGDGINEVKAAINWQGVRRVEIYDHSADGTYKIEHVYITSRKSLHGYTSERNASEFVVVGNTTQYTADNWQKTEADESDNSDGNSEGKQTAAEPSQSNTTRIQKTITQKTYRIMKTNEKNTVTKLKYVGVDDWGNNKYEGKNGRIYVDVANSKDPRFPTSLHTVTRDWGEPCEPVHFDNIKVTGWTDEDQAQKVFQFEYMMLSALQMKISNYKAWGYTKESIIKEMRHYYALLPVKPEWCTKEDIDNYERNLL